MPLMPLQRPGKGPRTGGPGGINMSSTYQSFADTGPTYSYLDLSRARSDESLMWNAGEEAAAVVAELRASLASPLQHVPKKGAKPKGQEADDEEDEGVDTGCPTVRLRTRDDISVLSAGGSIRGSRPSLCGRSLSFTDLQSCVTASAEDLHMFCFHPARLPCTAHCVGSPAASPTGSSSSSGHSSYSSGSSQGSGVLMIPGKRHHHMRTFGGSWRSLLRMGSMSVRGKPSGAPPTVKKVSPPTVPDTVSLGSNRNSGSSFSSGVYSQPGDQRASYSSSISDDNPDLPPPRSPARGCDHGQLGRTSSISSGTGPNNNVPNNANNNNNNSGINNNNSPSHFHNNTQFTFPQQPHQVPQFAHLMCPKTSPGSPHHVPPDSTYQYLQYQHQASLEDQGIDVQSPGRSSPGSGSGSSTTGSTASSGGCRNSTTSLDSGRASTSTHTHQHRLSGQSYDSAGSILRHSYHSSSSSLGSMEHDQTHVNVPELLNNGVRDSEVLRAWLTDLRMDEYIEKFVAAGYDMPTISRMTPEDLNAIGITKPVHRKKLKAEINRLNISDGLPDFIPSRLEEWLKILRLEEYCNSLRSQKYESVEQMTQITWEDLEDIGINKLGHQKKVMLAIKRVKDIMSGKKFSTGQEPRQSHYGTHEIMISRDTGDVREQFTGVPEFRTFTGPNPPNYNSGEHPRMLGPSESHYGVPSHYAPGGQYVQAPHARVTLPPQSQFPGVQFSAPGPMPPQPPQLILPGQGNAQLQYRPDFVAVQVRPGAGRGRGIDGADEPIYGTYQTFHPDQRLTQGNGPLSLGNFPARQFPPGTSNHPQRSQDDGDITPTNEFAMCAYEGAGTLPRSRTANKFRPVAKVTAKTRVDIHEAPQFIKPDPPAKPNQEENLMVKTLNRANSEKNYSSHTGTNSTNNTPQGTPKKLPPPPPRRSNSISESTKNSESSRESQYGYLRRGLSYGYMGIKNNLQPDVTPDLPPPPAPNDVGNHQHLPDDFPPPPPPLTCVTMASSARCTSASATITTSSLTSDSLATTQSSTTPSPDTEAVEFRARRNDSNASFKSTSSTESDSLPFANENAGTIKQRAFPRPPHHLGGGLVNALDSCNSPLHTPQSSPAVQRKEGLANLRHPHNITAMPTPPPSSTLAKSNSGSPEATGDVLNDIGNMLANLTDELDAMLEQEMVVKN
ncbi:unnamed protein product [Meganyctiphanes norvegica]|uniref:SAM domain-containing protein n=1 Tax=Meganyctiphanes norvegica TaxID=48144 RepID=A0AAV2PKB8_MEGNR